MVLHHRQRCLSEGDMVTGCISAHPRAQRLESLLEFLDVISAAELRIGPDCEVLHRTGDTPRQAVHVLRSYCDSGEGHELRKWLEAQYGSEAAACAFCPLERIADLLQEMRNDVVDLSTAGVSAVDYPDDVFWIRIDSIEVRWESIRQQAEAARSCLAGLKTPNGDAAG